MAAVRGRSACITHSWLLPLTTVSVGIAREWRLGTSLVRVASDCLALRRWTDGWKQSESNTSNNPAEKSYNFLQFLGCLCMSFTVIVFFMHDVCVHTCTCWVIYHEFSYKSLSVCGYVSSLLASSCGCCLMKNAAVFMFVFCCVKSLAAAPESAEKNKLNIWRRCLLSPTMVVQLWVV